MLVVEDTESNEIHRFFIVDALLQLGEVSAGSEKRAFDIDRALSYYSLVEDQLFDLSSRHLGAYRYIPRRVYVHLKEPPILSDIYKGIGESNPQHWFADTFVIRPLLSLQAVPLPHRLQTRNMELAERWATQPPHSHRAYPTEDLRFNIKGSSGWACVVRGRGLMNDLSSYKKRSLIETITRGSPVFVELDDLGEADSLLEWLVSLKNLKLAPKSIILSVKSFEVWCEHLNRLLELPQMSLLTSNATISSLATIIEHLKKNLKAEWSKKLIFSSSYPETQTGDPIPEILSYLLSRKLSARPIDLHRILGVNMLSKMNCRPPYLEYNDAGGEVTAEGLLGRTALKELMRVLQMTARRKSLSVMSFEYMFQPDGAGIDFNTAVMTVKNAHARTSTSIALRVERDEALLVAGWRPSFNAFLESRDTNLFTTQIRYATKSHGLILTSPSHLPKAIEGLAACLQIRRLNEVIAASRFNPAEGELREGQLGIRSNYMREIEANEHDTVIAMNMEKGQWWGSRITEVDSVSGKAVLIPKLTLDLLGLHKESVIDLVKYEGKIKKPEEVIFHYKSKGPSRSEELLSAVYLHRDEIKQSIKSIIVGKGTKLNVLPDSPYSLELSLAQSVPSLDRGELASLEASHMHFIPKAVLDDFNIGLVLIESESNEPPISIRSLESLQEAIENLPIETQEKEKLLPFIQESVSPQNAFKLLSILSLGLLRHNRTEGRLGVTVVGKKANSFKIQKGSLVQNHIKFDEDLSTKEVFTSLLYFLLDSSLETREPPLASLLYRTIAEILEDFGTDRPTLILTLGGHVKKDDERNPFLETLKRLPRHLIKCVSLGKRAADSFGILSEISHDMIHLESIHPHEFMGQLIEALEATCTKNTTK